jgi:TonB family protein
MSRTVTVLLVAAALAMIAWNVHAQTKESPLLLYNGEYPAPKKTKTVVPQYPSTAHSGSMILELTIRPDGKVEAVKAIRPRVGAMDAAIAAVKQWQFEPVLFRGKRAWAVLDIVIRNPWDSRDVTPGSVAPRKHTSERSPRPTCVSQFGERVLPPRKVRDSKPDISDLASIETHASVLIFEITVLPSGDVTNVRLMKKADPKAPWPTLVERWRSAIAEWRYEPATLDRKPIAACLTVTVNIHVT